MIRIPKGFYLVKGTLLRDSAPLRRGDRLHITKNDSGYLAYDVTQNRYEYIESSLFHDETAFNVEEVIR